MFGWLTAPLKQCPDTTFDFFNKPVKPHYFKARKK